MKRAAPKRKPRTIKVWTHVENGFVFFNWQHGLNAKYLRTCGYERAILTLTGKRKPKGGDPG